MEGLKERKREGHCGSGLREVVECSRGSETERKGKGRTGGPW